MGRVVELSPIILKVELVNRPHSGTTLRPRTVGKRRDGRLLEIRRQRGLGVLATDVRLRNGRKSGRSASPSCPAATK